MHEEIEHFIKRLEEERDSYIAQRDKAISEIAKRDAAIESLRQLAPPALQMPTPPVTLSERKASWIPQPVDSYQPSRVPSAKVKTVAPPSQPDHGARPEGAGPKWISLLASQASPFALALAFLRNAPNPFTSAQLNSALAALRNIKGGAGYTTLDPLKKAGVIVAVEGADNLWNILDRNRGGILANRFLWCSPDILNIYDWASIRREAVILLLREHPEGLKISVIAKTLMNCDWLHAPVDPHLIKADMRQLEAKGITQQNAIEKTWRLTPQSEKPTQSSLLSGDQTDMAAWRN